MNDLPRFLLYHEQSDTTGFADASAIWPCGSLLLRINDHWFFARDCVDAL